MVAMAGSWQQRLLGQPPQQVSNLTFVLFLLYIIDYFVRISARIPGAGVIRPTLLMAALITLLLVVQSAKLRQRWSNESSKAMKTLLLYITLTLPFVSWPGSVIQNNLPEFVKAVIFFYFTLAIIDSPSRLKIFLAVFICCQVWRVLEPLYLNITEDYWGSSTYIGDGEMAQRLAGGPYDVINGNELGFVIATIIPFLHYLLFPRGKLAKLVYLSLLPPLLYALVLTMSRGAFLALLVVFFFIFIRSQRKAFLVMLAIAIAIFGWSRMSDVQRERYLSLTGADVRGASTAKGRVDGVFQELEVAMQRPIFGHGVGTTPEAKFHHHGSVKASHSLPMELIIEIGLIGFVLFFRLILSAWRNLKRMLTALEVKSDDSAEWRFRRDLVHAMQCLFWMYAFYCLNYWGLSQYYWYLFCALSVVIPAQLGGGVKNTDECGEPSEKQQAKNSAHRPLAGRRHPHLHQVRF